jgi:hypothetical protein
MQQVSVQIDNSLSQAVRDRYRCPKEYLDLRLSGALSADSGYFQFGPGTTCFGRTAKGLHRASEAASHLADANRHAIIDEGSVSLPFDPTEVIDNLCRERYQSSQWSRSDRLLKSIYYWFRPLTNRALRKSVQKLRAVQGRKNQFPKWPVDTTVERLCESVLLLSLEAKGVDRIPFIWFWPDGARGCVSITHDVETEAGRAFCSRMFDIDKSFGVKASYQIVPEGRYTVTSEFLNRLRASGNEICIQDLNHDGRLFDHYERFRRRVASINRYGREFGATGFRSAVLYRRPEWYGELDFSFDMSMPNVASLDPQRGGCCTVMPYFIGDMLEIPVTTCQDYTLFHVLGDLSIDLWKTQLQSIFACNGLASFIVHPDYILEPETMAVYRSLLNWLRELRRREHLWFAIPGEIDTWWRARSRMSIIRDAGSWRIVGEGAERARLAFASVADGKLVYETENTASEHLLPARRIETGTRRKSNFRG